MKKNFQAILSGLTGMAGLIAFYFLTMRLFTGSWEIALSQFKALWYFMIPLSIGFGAQVGLYKRISDLRKMNSTKNVMMANTTTSTVGMIACCAHHITDILPIIGLSAVSIFLVKFQTPILIVGIISNIFGIIYLLKVAREISINRL